MVEKINGNCCFVYFKSQWHYQDQCKLHTSILQQSIFQHISFRIKKVILRLHIKTWFSSDVFTPRWFNLKLRKHQTKCSCINYLNAHTSPLRLSRKCPQVTLIGKLGKMTNRLCVNKPERFMPLDLLISVKHGEF